VFAELLLTRLRLGEALRDIVSDPAAALRFLNPGRMIRVDSTPPDPHRQLPSLGQYVQPAAAAAAAAAAAGDGDAQQAAAGASNGVQHDKAGREAAAAAGAAAAAAGDTPDADASSSSSGVLRGAGPEVVAAVDASSVWGVLINFQKAGKAKQSSSSAADGSEEDGSRGSSTRYAIDVLVNVDPATLPRGAAEGATGSASSRGVLPRLLAPGAGGGVAVVLTLPLDHLVCFSAIRLRVVKDLRAAEARSSMLAAAAEVMKRHPGAAGSGAVGPQLPLLDPVSDMKVCRGVRVCCSRICAVFGVLHVRCPFGVMCCVLVPQYRCHCL
jgi:hypothetical protein